MSTVSNAAGRPMSVLERARALEARSGGPKPGAAGGPSSRTISSTTFAPSKVGNTAEAGSVGAPRPAGVATKDASMEEAAPRTSRCATIARLLDDADATAVQQKPAQDVSSGSSSLAETAPNNYKISKSTHKKKSLAAKIASDKTRANAMSAKRASSSSSSSSKKLTSTASTPAFLTRAVASWNKTEKYFDRLDSDPSSSEGSGNEDGGVDAISDDDSSCSEASTNCTGSTHTSVTNSFTAASSVTSATIDTTAGNNSEGGAPSSSSSSRVGRTQYESSDSETDDDELSGYSGAMTASRGERVGISTRPVSIDSPPQVIRSKMPPQQAPAGSTSSSAELNFHGGDRSSDEETAIHDNTTTSRPVVQSKSSRADNSAAIDEASTSFCSASSSASSNGSVDSTKATVTKQSSNAIETSGRRANQSAAVAVVTPDEKSSKQAPPPLDGDDAKVKPLWQCRLEDMRLRQELMQELMRREEIAATTASHNNNSGPSSCTITPPRRTKLPAKMHRQVVAGEEDWSKDFAEETFVAFDDDIFGRSEI